MKQNQKGLCQECRRITNQTLSIMEKKLPYSDLTADVLVYSCNICSTPCVLPHEGLTVYHEAIKEHKKTMPSIDIVLADIPKEQLFRWVDHFNHDTDESEVCNCKSHEKGVNCDNLLYKNYYTKKDWEDYLKKLS